jgi:hypothetical protein
MNSLNYRHTVFVCQADIFCCEFLTSEMLPESATDIQRAANLLSHSDSKELAKKCQMINRLQRQTWS